MSMQELGDPSLRHHNLCKQNKTPEPPEAFHPMVGSLRERPEINTALVILHTCTTCGMEGLRLSHPNTQYM